MIGLLRQRGLRKIDCIRVVQVAIGLSHGEAKRLVHHSPVWADRREADEAVEEMFWRALFISALVGEAEVTAPAEDVAECHERQQRARTQLHQAAAGLPDELLTRYRESMAENLHGRAFAAPVAVWSPWSAAAVPLGSREDDREDVAGRVVAATAPP
ncbi:hypothetical protein C8D87_101990 [Lentzea atacamensis]|uniref:Uncharacterized protein n=1 Tax=Lentzea atacamensis TaxID=531938 RepID=A0ABX9EKK0_9PSEU|nr:hypothetical protein C8D87_101990 [Lentzea atacamensis]